MTRRRVPGARALAVALLGVAGAAILAPAVLAGGGERHVLAWPPTRYTSAELILWLEEPAAAASVQVTGRGLDTTVDLSGSAATRIPLPIGAQCRAGVDACAIIAERVAGSGAFVAALQSPDTAGAADTLLATAHDTVLLPPASAAAFSHVLLSLPNPPLSPFPQSQSFASVVPTAWPARVSVAATCAPAQDVVLEASEVLTLTCAGPGDDLSGASVESDVAGIVLSGNVVTCAPWDGAGLSGDLALDLSPARRAGPTTLVVPPLPRLSALAGRGDIVRVLALEDANITIVDATGSTQAILAAGRTLDLDTAGGAVDRCLRIESSAAVAAWHVPKSRAERGQGDPAAVPIVPREAFTRRARFFAPDGYSEANVVAIVTEAGASVRLDGVAIPRSSWTPAPGAGLEHAVVALPAPASGAGSVHELEADAPFGAWIVAFGGYKAHGMAAALEWPAPPAATSVLRGLLPNALAGIATTTQRSWADTVAFEPRVFYAVGDDAALLRVAPCADGVCLSW